MSSPQSPGTANDTAPGETQLPNPTSAEIQSLEHKKHIRPTSTLHKKVSSKRLVGRLPISPIETSPSQSGTESVSRTSSAPPRLKEKQSRAAEKHDTQQGRADQPAEQHDGSSKHHHHRLSASAGSVTGLLEQLKDWAHAERQRQKNRREKKSAKKTEHHRGIAPTKVDGAVEGDEFGEPLSLVSSGDEAAQVALDAFDALVAAAEASCLEEYPRRPCAHRRTSRRKHARHASDTDYASDGEPVVPSCEEVLQTPEEVGMDEFKSQVLKLAHTLKCKGWRRVDLDRYKEVTVERISGAFTNVVFVVSPPSELPSVPTHDLQSTSTLSLSSMKIPSKLLLRIYGPQVSHLIDRDTELSILRRLARKRIGPRLLGTFLNGRFEEFLPSRTLTRDDLRNPETSRHIAKRLKELHEGIELEKEEKEGGPIVWRNWQKWVVRARSVMAIVEANQERDIGPVVGCSWEKFENMVDRYKKWLYARYGGFEGVKEILVFAHNDTQYGNILRLEPTGKSPLLLPMNEHRQLVVIDFEYASANPPGFEFANHFCEWMADYHDPTTAYYLHESQFPKHEQQRNFLRAYVEHRLSGSNNTRTPITGPSPSPSFNLDARTPVPSYKEEEAARQKLVEREVEHLIEECRVWRAAGHAMWCAWGIVQAKVELDGAKKEGLPKESSPENETALSKEESAAASDIKDKREEEEDEFDYLAHAQQRALLFWGDMLGLGVVKPEEVDEYILKNAKRLSDGAR